MDVCSGYNHDKHAEIAHTEGSTSCPLCEMKAERDDEEKQKEKAEGDLETLKAAHALVVENLETLREKTKHMTWAVEPVEEPKL